MCTVISPDLGHKQISRLLRLPHQNAEYVENVVKYITLSIRKVGETCYINLGVLDIDMAPVCA